MNRSQPRRALTMNAGPTGSSSPSKAMAFAWGCQGLKLNATFLLLEAPLRPLQSFNLHLPAEHALTRYILLEWPPSNRPASRQASISGPHSTRRPRG